MRKHKVPLTDEQRELRRPKYKSDEEKKRSLRLGWEKRKQKPEYQEYREAQRQRRLGTKLSDATKEKMGKSQQIVQAKFKGIKKEITNEQHEKLSNAHKGYKHTEETKAKMRESHARRLERMRIGKKAESPLLYKQMPLFCNGLAS